MKSRLSRLLLLLSLVAVLVVGVLPVSAQDNILRITALSDIRTADPHIAYELDTWPVVSLFYTGLVRLESADEPAPALAESFEISEDGLRYSFTLREGLTFSNGRPLTTADVVYTWERWNSPEVPSPTAYFFDSLTGVADFRAGTADTISGIEVVDDRTVVFNFDYPVWTMIQRFALPPSGIIASEGVEAAGDNFGRAPLGAGPFVLDSWESGVAIRGSRNPNYYLAGQPYVDGFELTVGVEPSVGILRAEAGEADLSIDFVPNSDYPRIATDPVLAEQLLATSAFPNIDYVVYNVRQAPFDSLEVREALSIAIDRERLNQILNGRAAPANGPVPPGVPGDNTEEAPIAYDPEAALELLATAGYAEGFTTDIFTTTDPTNLAISQAIAADWAAVGVNATITSVDNAQFLDVLINQPDSVQVTVTNWYLDYSDPSNIYEPLLGCNGSYNWGGYCNEELDALFAENNLIPFGEARWTAFAEFEALLKANAPVAFLHHQQNYYFTSARVNIETDAATLLRWDEASLE